MVQIVMTRIILYQMDGITNVYHTPYMIDLISQGSVIIPDLEVPISEMFWHPEQRAHLYVPGSEKLSVTLVGELSFLNSNTDFPAVNGVPLLKPENNIDWFL